MILAPVAVEHVDDDVQMRVDVGNVPRQAGVGLAELRVGALLRGGEPSTTSPQAPDQSGQTDQPVGDAVR